MGRDKSFYITTPIYYVNDSPHIGHAYTTIACDVMARFMRLDGAEVKFLTGTDEHGQKVDKAAAAAGKNPQAFCDEVSQRFRNLVKDPKKPDGGQNVLGISNDDFIRTTEERHKKACQALWQKIAAGKTPKGRENIYLDNYGGWYSVRDEAYYTEAELVEKDGKKLAPTGAEVEWVEEESYFFRLSDYQEALLEFYKAHEDFVVPAHRLNEVKRFVEGGLQDLSISRTKFKWGVPVPDAPEHVMYVWIDALTNYLTAVGYPDTNAPEYQKFWGTKEDPRAVHVIGKDIIRFHAVYWPAFLMAADLPLPRQIVAHGWWTIEGEKMSKSLGNVLSPQDMIAKAGGVDQLRYFMLAAMPFGNDGDFAQGRMIETVNANLANNIGNLVQRALSMIQKNCGGKVPNKQKKKETLTLESLIKRFLYSIGTAGKLGRWHGDLNAYKDQKKHIESAELQELIRPMIYLSNALNECFQELQPWVQFKQEKRELAESTLYYVAEGIRCIAILLQPFCPTAAAKILDQLAVPEDERTFTHLDEKYALKPGTPLPVPQGVFPRIMVETKK